MKILQIINNVSFHYEIIETLIVKYQEIIKNKVDIIKVHCKDNKLKQYLKQKYPKVLFVNSKVFDYYINATFYPTELKNIINLDKSKYFYISHRVDSKCLEHSNIFYLTPLSKKNYLSFDILPFKENKKLASIPIYAVQGNLNYGRRNYNLLIKILEETFDKNFKIKLIGRGELPKELLPYKNKIILKNNLNFIDFHKEFLDVYGILPLISKKTHPQYYTNQLTSTINYAKAYNLKAIIDKDLQDIYQLENAEVYTGDIVMAFKKSLDNFYL
ncbi:hypothetical protein crov262 [Cafeteria roenbergensis virus]|uniref:Uncharacterized protein n=1 Tax=Cafeteria roenbergensis virus (strain BV-PW1) TaxID=693272 RepID=E3T532_CROVB|nr:hypothetical protein crov262 [Cafeteria roenbergensis virus BV-PW1]ADO67295.1 hypothetical protein crov262 [Cafeteria roenbergensis virus BV-PW1]